MEVLQKIRGSTDVRAEMDEMIASATDHAGGLKESVTVRGLLDDPRIRRALVLGCGLQMLQQLSGINTVMYYSASIFRWGSAWRGEQPVCRRVVGLDMSFVACFLRITLHFLVAMDFTRGLTKKRTAE